MKVKVKNKEEERAKNKRLNRQRARARGTRATVGEQREAGERLCVVLWCLVLSRVMLCVVVVLLLSGGLLSLRSWLCQCCRM